MGEEIRAEMPRIEFTPISKFKKIKDKLVETWIFTIMFKTQAHLI